MKYLSDYIEVEQNELFKRLGVFFAFSQKQFDEQKQENVKYVSCGYGAICPKENVSEFKTQLEAISKKGIANDIRENGKTEIIKRELYNHEAFYTGRIDDTKDTLEPYGITDAEIMAVYNSEYPNYLEHNQY